MQMDLADFYKHHISPTQMSTTWIFNVSGNDDVIPVRVDTESDRKFLHPVTIGGATGTILNHQTENEILHPDISKFGHTTNVLVYSFLDNNRGQQFTREEIRRSLESHKLALEENGMEEQHLTRIRTGKASVNYWIDRLVENGSVNKKHSNPVLFWLAR